MIVAGDQQLLKQINRMALVRQLCGAPGLSRAALAEAVGLTKSTVSLLVRELLDEGWLSESELVATGALGRRATPLRLDSGRLALLGADLGIGGARVVATDLLGTVLAERALPYPDPADPAACVGLIADALVAMAAPGGALAGRAPLGLGIGVPGVVDDATGVLRYAPHLGWRDVDVLGRLRAHCAGTALAGLPLFIQNEANVAALAELEFAGQVGADPLIYLSIGYGVGAGIVVNGRLLTGLYGFAGEVGHTILQQGGPRCSCGRRGCADALIGLQALMDAVYGQPCPPEPERLERLFAQAGAGEPAACQAVEAAGRHMGVLLNNLWVAFDPMCIVVGGAALRLGERFLAPGRAVLRAYAEATQLPAPVIRTPHFGANAIAIGGAAMARHHLMRPFGGQGAGWLPRA
ncbi:Sugar kinase of the NBD/HSP70 family, may contain an N-terminal HTH domain [Duganella sp. CF517]|uniref:ROK family transcriptional regulator n=1 Tax=Duganella sp. CF517 TaxID=1881038 RepID=UPI0008C6B6A0|nr:ROK family transcriptional regulator [Duganella sp. CF517]SEO46981.1 Sugar kinase of the NBD/HSP70 family, may contain an N-terminal HTH domain [Duganella sp. CF517]